MSQSRRGTSRFSTISEKKGGKCCRAVESRIICKFQVDQKEVSIGFTVIDKTTKYLSPISVNEFGLAIGFRMTRGGGAQFDSENSEECSPEFAHEDRVTIGDYFKRKSMMAIDVSVK
jgi:hypothetical protein